jgi:hypothetical protein
VSATRDFPLSVEARTILNRIKLRFNPRDVTPDKAVDDHFLETLGDLLNPGKFDPYNLDSSWRRLSDDAVDQAREILKREWEKTKEISRPEVGDEFE